jgi:hypothetical protein
LLLLVSPLVASGLVSAVAVGRRAPVWNPPRGGRGRLPPDAERAAVQALATLPAGPARGLLKDLVRRAAASPPEGAPVGPLVTAACSAARELATLESHQDDHQGGRVRRRSGLRRPTGGTRGRKEMAKQ